MINIIVVTIFIILLVWSQKRRMFPEQHSSLHRWKETTMEAKQEQSSSFCGSCHWGGKQRERDFISSWLLSTLAQSFSLPHALYLSQVHTHTLSLSSAHTCTHTHCFSQIISCFLYFSIIWRFACQGLLSRTMWTNKHAASTPPQAEHSLTPRPYPHVFIASLSLSLFHSGKSPFLLLCVSPIFSSSSFFQQLQFSLEVRVIAGPHHFCLVDMIAESCRVLLLLPPP